MSTLRVGLLVTMALVCAALAACGEDADEARASGCAVPDTCDITQTACQRDVLALTACVRGDALPELPEFRVIDASGLRDELEAEAEGRGASDHAFDKALAAFGLLPADKSGDDAVIDLEVASLAAYYDDDKQRVTVIADASGDRTSHMYVLSHELTHYLQDITTGFDSLRKRFAESSDQTIALSALVEGEAVATSTRALATLHGRPVSHIDWDKLFGDMLDGLLDDAAYAEAPLFVDATQLPYPVGGRYVEQVWEEYGRRHVDALFRNAPESMLDWTQAYGDGKPKQSLLEPLDCAPPLAPEGLFFELHGLDSLGFTGALALLTATDPDIDPNAEASEKADAAVRADYDMAGKLRGDAIAVYTIMRGAVTAPVLATWRLRFADEATARAVEARAGAALDVTSKRFGQEVLLVTRDAGDVYTDDELARCPKLEDLKPATPAGTMTALRHAVR
jgi:hypothetical protein